jgi:antibiotic biosynthesis monooxygenase (ABM) superfamily enzyme
VFVTISTYRAKPGEEDAIVALHEDWQLTRRTRTKGYVSGELLRSLCDGQTFTDIARFENQAVARAHAEDPEQEAWHRRLVSLTESEPVMANYQAEWWT